MLDFARGKRLEAIIAFVALFALGFTASSEPPRVLSNDNRTSAGRQRGDTLDLHLEVRLARWYPQADSGPYIDVPAFAEVGKPPQIPAPLIRARRGTVIVLRLKNSLSDSALTMH